MPRPNQDRIPITFYISRDGLAAIDQLATTRGETRSDTLRAMLKFALPKMAR